LKSTDIIIGRQPLIEAMEAGRAIDKILFQRNVSGESIGDIRRLAEKRGIPIQQVPPEKLMSITRANHQGVVALAALVAYMDLQTVIDLVVAEVKTPLFILLDGVTHVRNIGAIGRSAVCCGAQALIIPDKGVAAINEEALKSSAGALERIHICRVSSLLKAVDTLHLNGIAAFATAMKGQKKVYELPLDLPCCLMMGSEERGLQPYLNKAADELFTIPMTGGFDSLNVSVAAGIILYEAMKKRMAGESVVS
jgi:23S rRNA (guanosine2251-2'-O)-methyltransferase